MRKRNLTHTELDAFSGQFSTAGGHIQHVGQEAIDTLRCGQPLSPGQRTSWRSSTDCTPAPPWAKSSGASCCWR